MSDDNELTFIRCPGCRSLVPAIATRCRMCGQLLAGSKEAKKESELESPVERKSRIRQKTLSLDQDQISDVKEVLTAKKDHPSHNGEEKGSGISPVSRFLQSGRKETVEPTPAADSEKGTVVSEEKKPATPHREPLRFGRASGATEVFKPVPPKVEEPVVEPSEESLDNNDYDGYDAFSEEEEHEEVIDFGEEPSPVADVKKKRKRRRRKKKHPLAVPGSEEPKQSYQESSLAPNNTRSEPVFEPKVSWKEDRDSDKVMMSSPRPEEIVSKKEIEREPAVQNTQPKLIKEEEKKVMSTLNENTEKGSKLKLEGRLIGWLVTYRNDFRGAPIEIREGRFFIGGAKLRDSDLVLADDSLSVPHCLVKAEAKDGLVVQDLMSEKGSFIKKQGSNRYELITVPTVISHGDWLKFGEYEVMACIVPTDARSQK